MVQVQFFVVLYPPKVSLKIIEDFLFKTKFTQEMFFIPLGSLVCIFIQCFIVSLPPAATKGSTQRRKGGHENKR